MKTLDQYGAFLLGVAARKLFPQARYRGAFVHSRGFTVKFLDGSSFQEGHLSMLDQEIRKLQKSPYEIMEMIGENAMEMLDHYGQPSWRPLSGPIFIAKTESFYEPCWSKPQKTDEIALLGFKQNGKEISIEGKAFESRLSKQRFLRLYRKWHDHWTLSSQLELYSGQEVYPRGILLKRLIIEMQQNFSLSMGFLPVETSNPQIYAQEKQMDRLLSRGEHLAFGEQSCISSLQMIQKWIDLFGFEGQWFLSDKKLKKDFRRVLEASRISYKIDPEQDQVELELRIQDSLGCEQCVSKVSSAKGGICFLLVENIDRWIGLLIEKDQGKFPSWLEPEQVRLIVERDVCFTEVTKKLRGGKIRFTVDRGEGPLKEKMYRALRVNVPYVMVFGKHEEKTNQMTIRALGSRKSETISLMQFDQFISELRFEN